MEGDGGGGGGGGGCGSSEGERKQPPDGAEPRVKRKMKTAAQLEVLEKTYQVENYPSESKRAELSAQLGLSDRQLQMWFCHRRLKDRKEPSTKRQRKVGAASPPDGTPPKMPPPPPAPLPAMKDELGIEFLNEQGSVSGAGSSPYRHMDTRRAIFTRPTGVAVPRISPSYRYYDPPQPIVDHPAIALIEAQLGEPLSEDGPALGVEFDPLPPGAFGAPIDAPVAPQKRHGRTYEPSLYERPDAKVIKGPGRALHEYQFLPDQPVRSDSCERTQSHFYGSPSDGPVTRNLPLSAARAYMNSSEDLPLGYTLPAQMPSLSLMSHQSKKGHLLPSSSGEHDGITHKSPFINMAVDSPFSSHPISGLDNALISSEMHTLNGEDIARLERKRKNEEARLAKEAEAREKKMRKELEKQDILRRKREEQLRKEMERHDRERKKEEERLLREKQREEERYQREQKREIERREKFLQKESIRAEKNRQKEEIRKEKEAARQKAANDRAAARRIAKESMEPIEDERLELMEIAVSRKELPSILSLDSETLENLDSFRDLLKAFPPQSVQLKRPFAMQPWADSDENVGNLLMVWRFLITFADVLGLWPFTLDEFLQALHDYEPRLIGEIHIGLLKCIVKDIEDVARIPSAVPGMIQNSAPNPGGGHPLLVEGAYAWGFDIRSWQRHLNPLTWPEILRQFALSAGFGPQLKKRNIEPAYVRDDNEGDDGADIISNLRTGAAVENAVAIMQERGYGNPRRSRHRLTPGTVKFAAFHVLSLEGRTGLNILEVAERIQKSGLRDLTTSKTPEASIAAALSRDTKLFERVAPSTYCVRTPYRKDPADTEAILSAAREKIRVFKSGFDGVEADDVEKDDSSESDTAEDPEVDDLNTVLTVNDAEPSFGVMRSEVSASVGNGVTIGNDAILGDLANGSEMTNCDLPLMRSTDIEFTIVGDSIPQTSNFDMVYEAPDIDQEDNDINESCPGEPWVQGLVEGEYSDLSVEERLNALVVLIGVVTEGNTIRVVLEERLEAANALKKQMLSEVQVDKRRVKDEYLMKAQISSTSLNRQEPVAVAGTESRQSPVPSLVGKLDEELQNPMVQQTPLRDPQIEQKSHSDLPFEKNSVTPDTFVSPDNLALQQTAYALERSRTQVKSYISYKAEEMYVYRSLPIGLDRQRNRYWQFMASASCSDPGSGRIFVELCNGGWRLIDSAEGFDDLLASLDVRGIRESNLHEFLQKIEPSFKETLKMKQVVAATRKQHKDAVGGEASEARASLDPHSSSGIHSPGSSICALNSNSPESSSSFHVECGKGKLESGKILKRYRDSADWMWKGCLSSSVVCAIKYGKRRCTQLLEICDHCNDLYFFEDKHCTMCHRTFISHEEKFSFSQHISVCEETLKVNPTQRLLGQSPVRITLLKALLALVEVSIPSEALQPFWSDWYRGLWGRKLHMSASADEILQVLSLLEGAVKRDFLSSEFQTTDELLGSSKTSVSRTDVTFELGAVAVLPWVPQTTAAVTLRLMELDSAISYLLDQKPLHDKDSEAADLMKLQSKYAVVRNIQEDELAGPHGQQLQEDTWMDPDGRYKTSRCVRARGNRSGNGKGGGRTRGGRSQRRAAGSRAELGRRTRVITSEPLGQVLGRWKSTSQGSGGRKRRRSARSRQKPTKKAGSVGSQRHVPEQINVDRSLGIYGRDGWNGEESNLMQIEGATNDSYSERSDYGDDDNGRGTGYGYEIPMDNYRRVYNHEPAELSEGSDDNVDGGEEEVYENVDEDEDDQQDDNGDEYGEDVGDDFDRDEVGEDDYEDEVDVNATGYGGQRDLEIDGYFNPISDDEGDGIEDDGNANQDDYSGSSSSDEYSD